MPHGAGDGLRLDPGGPELHAYRLRQFVRQRHRADAHVPCDDRPPWLPPRRRRALPGDHLQGLQHDGRRRHGHAHWLLHGQPEVRPEPVRGHRRRGQGHELQGLLCDQSRHQGRQLPRHRGQDIGRGRRHQVLPEREVLGEPRGPGHPAQGLAPHGRARGLRGRGTDSGPHRAGLRRGRDRVPHALGHVYGAVQPWPLHDDHHHGDPHHHDHLHNYQDFDNHHELHGDQLDVHWHHDDKDHDDDDLDHGHHDHQDDDIDHNHNDHSHNEYSHNYHQDYNDINFGHSDVGYIDYNHGHTNHNQDDHDHADHDHADYNHDDHNHKDVDHDVNGHGHGHHSHSHADDDWHHYCLDVHNEHIHDDNHDCHHDDGLGDQHLHDPGPLQLLPLWAHRQPGAGHVPGGHDVHRHQDQPLHRGHRAAALLPAGPGPDRSGLLPHD
mmetsp:Transcript_91087/g.257921  ORF Transcript_91087/g.257921 Transcript_91087/m.257921 type:complete len:437 (+) Transcript_91087:493-1803(+)